MSADEFKDQGNVELNETTKRVKETHENGWTTKSKGWQYKWNIEDAKNTRLKAEGELEQVRHKTKNILKVILTNQNGKTGSSEVQFESIK